MLYYCFTTNLVTSRSDDDSALQYAYAKALGRALWLDLCSKTVLCNGVKFDITGKIILLRTTSDKAEIAIETIKALGGQLVEDNQAIKELKHWFMFLPPTRCIESFDSLSKMLDILKSKEIPWLQRDKSVFIKTVKKGYSSIISSNEILDKNFFDNITPKIKLNDEIVISQVEDIRTDSFGKMEWRCIVRYGQVQNISRYFHSLVHKIPQDIFHTASNMVAMLKAHGFSLSDYIMDLMLTADNRIEIVELNPLSSSMCYINNSIFTEAIDDILNVHLLYGFGYEYCFDYLSNPTRYHMSPQDNVKYTYVTE